jgi:hypothetical protein
VLAVGGDGYVEDMASRQIFPGLDGIHWPHHPLVSSEKTAYDYDKAMGHK